jgi:hypothetical protein
MASTIASVREQAEVGSVGLPDGREIGREDLKRSETRCLTDADLARYERFVRRWAPKVAPGEALSLEGFLTLMRESRRKWNEFSHREFRAHANGLSLSGHRRVFARMEAKGVLLKRLKPGRPSDYALNCPHYEKGGAEPEGQDAAKKG